MRLPAVYILLGVLFIVVTIIRPTQAKAAGNDLKVS